MKETDDIILMSHGAGGKLTARLINQTFLPRYGNQILASLGDGAVLKPLDGLPVLTTDSYVIQPRFFPGGNIGSLAVHGTVNDILMCGGIPRAISVGFILEEGLPIQDLETICEAMGHAAQEAGVQIVTGDTKVVERARGDGLYINTTGLGERAAACTMGPDAVSEGDKILVNGPLGQHGIAVMSARQELNFTARVESDSKALVKEAAALREFGDALKLLHDPTRGGLATCLNEAARETGKRIMIQESLLPEDKAVKSACEILGFDPLYIANEGKLVAVVAADQAEAACEAVRAAGSPEAALIGEVVAGDPLVMSVSPSGGERILDVLTGDPFPRIC